MNLAFHAGLPKTGSSYIQQFALLNREALQNLGLYYPVSDAIFQRSKRVRNPPGNGVGIHQALLDGDFRLLETRVNDAIGGAPADVDTVLLSHEGFYDSLTKIEAEQVHMFRSLGFESAKAILYVRDPVEWLFSLYKQKCRRGCRTSIREFLGESESIEKFLRFVDFSKNSDFIEPVFLDFKVCRPDLAGSILSSINMSNARKGHDFKKPQGVVNRSLSLREIRFLQSVSRLVGASVMYRISEFVSTWGRSANDDVGLQQFIDVLNCDASACREIKDYRSVARSVFSSPS